MRQPGTVPWKSKIVVGAVVGHGHARQFPVLLPELDESPFKITHDLTPT